MNKITAMVVDDEALARRRIVALLEARPEFEVLGECESGKQAIEAIESSAPDMVFLDIQMPGINGFDVLSTVEPAKLPVVVFVTAYDQYAVKAFEVRALDYLLKPFEDERFFETLDRVKKRIMSGESALSQRAMLDLLDAMQSKQYDIGRLLVKSSGHIHFLPFGRIDWVEAAGNYVRIHAGEVTHFMRETMTDIEAKLSPAGFARVHRSAIVNLRKISKLLPSKRGEFDVELLNGEKVTLSRKYRPVLEEKLGRLA